jgi:hypothetical protein
MVLMLPGVELSITLRHAMSGTACWRALLSNPNTVPCVWGASSPSSSVYLPVVYLVASLVGKGSVWEGGLRSDTSAHGNFVRAMRCMYKVWRSCSGFLRMAEKRNLGEDPNTGNFMVVAF